MGIAEYPDYGQQAVYLDEDGDTPETLPTASSLERLSAIKAKGVNIIAPPFGYLLTTTADNKTIIPSTYAISAKQAGLDIIPWTLERSGPLADVRADEEYYYGFFAQGVSYDGQIYEVLTVLGWGMVGSRGECASVCMVWKSQMQIYVDSEW